RPGEGPVTPWVELRILPPAQTATAKCADSSGRGLDSHPRTDLRQRTPGTVRLAGVANLPTVVDHAVAEYRPLFFGDEPHQVALDRLRVGLRGQPHAAAESAQMGIDRDAGHAEGVAEDDVGRLAADAGQGYQLFHRRGDFAAMLFHDLLAAGNEVAG